MHLTPFTAQADALVSSQITLPLLVALGSLQFFSTASCVSFYRKCQVLLAVKQKYTLTPPPTVSTSSVPCLVRFVRLPSHLEIDVVQYGPFQPHACMQPDSDKKKPLLYEGFSFRRNIALAASLLDPESLILHSSKKDDLPSVCLLLTALLLMYFFARRLAVATFFLLKIPRYLGRERKNSKDDQGCPFASSFRSPGKCLGKKAVNNFLNLELHKMEMSVLGRPISRKHARNRPLGVLNVLQRCYPRQAVTATDGIELYGRSTATY